MHLFDETAWQELNDLTFGKIEHREYSYYMKPGKLKISHIEGMTIEPERKNHTVTARSIERCPQKCTQFWPFKFSGRMPSTVRGKIWKYDFEAGIEMTDRLMDSIQGLDEFNWNSHPAVNNFIRFVQSYMKGFLNSAEMLMLDRGTDEAVVQDLFEKFSAINSVDNG